MNKNPYDVLGISPSASDDDVKRAYRDLTRRYHPDANVNNPLADLAEEKFKEVQEAYNTIMRERERNAGGYGGYNSYGNNQSAGWGQGSAQPNVELQAVANYINSGRYRDAINVLNRMPNRSPQWYYMSAVANAGIGNNILARDHAGQAVNMDPVNPQYRQLLNQLEWTGQRYQSNPYSGSYGPGSNSCGTGNMCCDLCIADQLCECMGGDLCACM